MLTTFKDEIAAISTESLLSLISGLIANEIFNACFDAALDEACKRDPDLAFTIEAMMA
jgi:hypothetical protein